MYAATQVWRVLEPLYMHLKSGYWGDYASLGNWEYMNRLSGSPYDIINPNGLGFVIIMTLPMTAVPGETGYDAAADRGGPSPSRCATRWC